MAKSCSVGVRRRGRLGRLRNFWSLAAVAAVAGVAALGIGVAPASAALVTVTLDGSAKGSVTSDPAGIDCSNVPGAEKTDCSFDFPLSFTGVKLSAVAVDGAVLKGWTGTAGGTCSGTTNPCETAAVLGNPLDATATFGLIPEKPVVATGAASDVVFPSAALSGTVNPNSADFGLSDCYFEYGTSIDYGSKAPCGPGLPGPGTDAVTVTGYAGLLESSTTYHYRIVASNPGGKSTGEDRTFTSAVAPPDSCPNAAIRAQQGAIAQRLPDCYAYEMATPQWTGGQRALVSAMGPEGTTMLFSSVGGFAGTENLMQQGTDYLARRTASGWTTQPLAPPGSDYLYLGPSGATDYTDDLSRTLWVGTASADIGTNRRTPLVRESDGSIRVAGPVIDDASPTGAVVGTSADLNTVVLWTKDRPTLTDGTSDARQTSRESLMVAVRRPDGSIDTRQVAFRDGATMFPTCTLYLGGYLGTTGVTGLHAVSADGQRIFFTPSLSLPACNSAAVNRVWMKEGTNDPIDLSATQCTTDCGVQQRAAFSGAARDGSRVYFKTEQKLVNGDQDTTGKMDLYEYDLEGSGNKLIPVTISSAPDGAAVLNVVRVSDDGSRVYFVANGRALAGANIHDDVPQPGQPNLYVYHRAALSPTGTIKFVGTLAAADSALWAGDQLRRIQVSDSGRFAFFVSAADLARDRLPGDTFDDVFRFDAESGDLQRIWPNAPEHNGAARSAGITGDFGKMTAGNRTGSLQSISNPHGLSRQFSDGGASFVFKTAERLSPDDVNEAADVYLWRAEGNEFLMLSSGRSIQPAGAGTMSPSGDAITLTTAEPLVPEHTSNAVAAYVVRRGGGFAAPPVSPAPCQGEACQGPSVPAAGPFATAGSSTFAGGGNVTSPGEEPKPKQQAKVRVAKLKVVRGNRTQVRVKVPAKGKIRVSGSGLARSSKSAKKAGTYRVTVKLSKRAKRTLRRKHRVKVRVSVRFTPAKGKSSVVRRSVTFKTAKKRSSKASSRSMRRASALSSDVQKGR